MFSTEIQCVSDVKRGSVTTRLVVTSASTPANGNAAWSEFSWTFDATRKDGSPHHARGRETQIFEKDNDGEWKLIHIHYSAIR